MTPCGKLAAELLLLLLLADGWQPASGKRASPVRDRRRGTKSAPMSATKSLTGSLKLVTSKKQAALPEPMPEFRFDPDGVWRRTAGKSGHVLRVEHSPTSRARCRRCGTAVAKGELRIGFPMHDSRGEDGAVTGWNHLNCSRVSVGECPVMDSTWLSGWEGLSKLQRSRVQHELTREDAPADSELDEDEPAGPANASAARMRAPAALVTQLLPFQEEGLAWMSGQEAATSSVLGIYNNDIGIYNI